MLLFIALPNNPPGKQWGEEKPLAFHPLTWKCISMQKCKQKMTQVKRRPESSFIVDRRFRLNISKCLKTILAEHYKIATPTYTSSPYPHFSPLSATLMFLHFSVAQGISSAQCLYFGFLLESPVSKGL